MNIDGKILKLRELSKDLRNRNCEVKWNNKEGPSLLDNNLSKNSLEVAIKEQKKLRSKNVKLGFTPKYFY
jgi:hypothetical protein